MAVRETRAALDLVALGALLAGSYLAVGLGGPPAVRVPAGLLLLLVLPGYAATALLYPSGARLTWFDRRAGRDAPEARPPQALHLAERVALSTLLSLLVAGAAGLAWVASGRTLEVTPLLIALSGFTAMAATGAAWRRSRVPPEERPAFRIGRPAWLDELSGAELGMQAVVVVSAVVLVGVILFAPPHVDAQRGYTAVHLLDAGGGIQCLPDRFINGTYRQAVPAEGCPADLSAITVGVANHEGASHQFTLFAFWSQNGTQAGRPAAPTSYSSFLQETFNLTHVPAPEEPLVGLDRQWERTLHLPEPAYPGWQRLHLQVHVDLEGAPVTLEPDSELVLLVERVDPP